MRNADAYHFYSFKANNNQKSLSLSAYVMHDEFMNGVYVKFYDNAVNILLQDIKLC